jgi:cytochrome P450
MFSEVIPESIQLTFDHPGAANRSTASFSQAMLNLVSGICKAYLGKVCLGPYKTVVGCWTAFNLRRYPSLHLSEQAPHVHKKCEQIAYKLKLNPTYPIIREVYLPDWPWYFAAMKVPCTNLQLSLPLPKWPTMTLHFVFDQYLNAEILKTHRFGNFDGSFTVDAMFQLLKVIFPDTKFSKEDTVMTCGAKFTAFARAKIAHTLYTSELDSIIHHEVKKLILRWKSYASSNTLFDLTAETRLFTSSVLARVVFGACYAGLEIAESIFFINQYLYAKTSRQLNSNDHTKFSRACQTFKCSIDQIIDSSESNPIPLFAGLTKAQQQAMCLVLFFVGQETTSFVFDHILAKLALDPPAQSRLFVAIQDHHTAGRTNYLQMPLLRELIDQRLLEIPPEQRVVRRLKYDTKLLFKTNGSHHTMVKAMCAGDVLIPQIKAVASHVLLKPGPSCKEGEFVHNQASIFGGGAHLCLGKELAYKELSLLIAEILWHFKLSTREIRLRSTLKVTMQAEPFFIRAEAVAASV